MENKKAVTFRIPEEAYELLRKASFEKRVSMTVLVVRAVRRMLKPAKATPERAA